MTLFTNFHALFHKIIPILLIAYTIERDVSRVDRVDGRGLGRIGDFQGLKYIRVEEMEPKCR